MHYYILCSHMDPIATQGAQSMEVPAWWMMWDTCGETVENISMNLKKEEKEDLTLGALK